MSILEMAFGHYQTVSISLRAALQPRAETFPFSAFCRNGPVGAIHRPVFFMRKSKRCRRTPNPALTAFNVGDLDPACLRSRIDKAWDKTSATYNFGRTLVKISVRFSSRFAIPLESQYICRRLFSLYGRE